MSDLISRTETIKAVSKTWINGTSLCKADEAIDEINKLPSAQQWIPCNERLPEEGNNILAQYMNGDVGIIAHVRMKAWNIITEPCATIIAWMPLPKPYQ